MIFLLLDLSPNNFRYEIFRFRARRSKNYEAYTAYMLNNFIRCRSRNLEIAVEKLLGDRSSRSIHRSRILPRFRYKIGILFFLHHTSRPPWALVRHMYKNRAKAHHVR